MTKGKAKLRVRNNNHRAVNTGIAAKEVPKQFLRISVVKISLRVTMQEVPNRGYEAQNTKQF
jgi:hypothetical protein